MTRLTFGFSPCPNDTFIFHALTHGIVEVPGVAFDTRLEDVETLNRMALTGTLDVTKISYGALPYLLDQYVLLRSGGALGRGCGPLVVARDPEVAGRLGSARIAIPGRYTTANLLLHLHQPHAPHRIEMPYDRIMPAVARGEVDAGVIIHESRFTYPEHRLVKVLDLGEWWEVTTGFPIPLGAIVARRTLGGTVLEIDQAVRRSVEHARAHPLESADYVRAHAQELSDTVTRSHIELYVSDFSADPGTEGVSAVRELLRRSAETGLHPVLTQDLFSGDSAT